MVSISQLLAFLLLVCQYSHNVFVSASSRGQSNSIKGESQSQNEKRDLQEEEVPSRKAPPIVSKDAFKFPRTRWQDRIVFPSEAPSSSPNSSPRITYVPGKLSTLANGLLISEGLQSRIIAESGEQVAFASGEKSNDDFHAEPDGAAVYENAETGGWIYVSNSELDDAKGGVGAIYFDKDGNVVDYKKLMTDTTRNCSGGKTPWHTWVTCEEYPEGKIYQIDPMGIREPEELTMGMDMGLFENFAYDIRDPSAPHFFVTEDWRFGPLRRFTPTKPNWEDPWTMLHGSGTLEWLILENDGTYYWTTDLEEARKNAEDYYRNSEGMDIFGNDLYFVSKVQKELFILNLDTLAYEKFSTESGLFDGQPDQMARLIQEGSSSKRENLLYFCEELGDDNGIHARDANGWFFTILESPDWVGETSGLTFSPDGKHMYFSYQLQGLIYDVWREDGLPFYGKTLDVHYHGNTDTRRKRRNS